MRVLYIRDNHKEEGMNLDSTNISREMLTGFLAERHSTRRFQDRDLAPEMLKEIIATAAYIPSGGNRHGHRFTVITRGSTRALLMKELTKMYRRRSRLMNSALLRTIAQPFVGPVMRDFLKDQTYGPVLRSIVAKLVSGEDPVFHGAPAAIVIHSPHTIPTPKEDCVIAGFAVTMAAHAMGLGACFVTLGQNAINSSVRCKAILGLSARERVHAVVVLGSPAVPNRQPAHRDAREIRFA